MNIYKVTTPRETYKIKAGNRSDARAAVLVSEEITIQHVDEKQEFKIVDISGKLPWHRSVGKNNKNSIKYVVVHHDAQHRPNVYDSLERYRAQANIHISKGYGNLAYHYRIDNVGTIFKTKDDAERGYHAGNWFVNLRSIAICFDGNMEIQELTDEQVAAYKWLMNHLTTQRPDLPLVLRGSERGHYQVRIGGTACPGKNTKPIIKDY